MDFTIAHFTLTLFLFQTVNAESKIAEASNLLKISMLETEQEELQSRNTSLLSTFNYLVESAVRNAQDELENEKLLFGIQMMKRTREIQKLDFNVTGIRTKIAANVSVFYNSMTRSWNKERNLFKKHDLEKPIHIEDFYRLQISERIKNEYARCLNRFIKLRLKMHECDSDKRERHSWNFGELMITFTSNNEDMPEIFPNDANDEEKPPKFDNDAQADELERFQRLALVIKDQLNELPKPKNEDQNNNVESEPNMPRWLLTETDIEQTRIQYSVLMEKLENKKNPKVAAINEIIEKYGYTMKYFCKTAADYFVGSSIYYECASKNDNECLDIMEQGLQEKRFEKFTKLNKEVQDKKLVPL